MYVSIYSVFFSLCIKLWIFFNFKKNMLNLYDLLLEYVYGFVYGFVYAIIKIKLKLIEHVKIYVDRYQEMYYKYSILISIFVFNL